MKLSYLALSALLPLISCLPNPTKRQVPSSVPTSSLPVPCIDTVGSTIWSYQGFIVSCTIPLPGPYRVEAQGGNGGSGSGGRGGYGTYAAATFTFQVGQTVNFAVGGHGNPSGQCDGSGCQFDGAPLIGSGGGASFVWTGSDVPLLAAAGGGGASDSRSGGDAAAPLGNQSAFVWPPTATTSKGGRVNALTLTAQGGAGAGFSAYATTNLKGPANLNGVSGLPLAGQFASGQAPTDANELAIAWNGAFPAAGSAGGTEFGGAGGGSGFCGGNAGSYNGKTSTAGQAGTTYIHSSAINPAIRTAPVTNTFVTFTYMGQ